MRFVHTRAAQSIGTSRVGVESGLARHPRAIDHYLADDGGDGDLTLPGEEAGAMVGHVEQRRVIEARAADGRACRERSRPPAR